VSSGITINSNVASLATQRRLGESTDRLRESFSRLSSGLRINRARDDAAGLSISESLRADAIVFNQGVRNLNDGISMLNIAEGALGELSSILIRQRELSEQAANGTLSRPQRLALQEEANALVDEYNRIVSSTSFNDISLFDPLSSSVRLQAGYGAEGALSFLLGASSSRSVGDGTFESTEGLAGTTDGQFVFVRTGDFNGDGITDLFGADYANVLNIFLGNGDGTFENPMTIDAGVGAVRTPIITDFNNDGRSDVLLGNGWTGVSVYLANADGSLGPQTSYTGGGGLFTWSTGASDLNQDGSADIVFNIDQTAYVFLNDGNGQFTKFATFSNTCGNLAIGDFNGDSIADIAGSNGLDLLKVYFGNGNGTFQSAISSPSHDLNNLDKVLLQSADFNRDGLSDLATLDNANSVSVLIAKGDGTFETRMSYAVGASPGEVAIGDLNGDGALDLAVTNDNYAADDNMRILLGKTDGSFDSAVNYTSASPRQKGACIYDFNGDGANDIALANNDDSISGDAGINFQFGSPTSTNSIAYLNLSTQQDARDAMSIIDAGLTRINQELGSVGAIQSRISTALSNLGQTSENYVSARSRITDADMAEESANLVKNQILQQTASEILSLANRLPELALRLIG